MTFYIWSSFYGIPEALDRFAWYDGSGIPLFIADGVERWSGGLPEGSQIDRYIPLVEGRLQRSSPLVMTASYGVSAGQVSLTVDIATDARIRTTDNQIDFFVCQEGLGGQSNMVVAMLAAEPFTLTDAGQAVTVQRQFTMDSAWTKEALRLVVCVQDQASQEVLQAALAVQDIPSATLPDPLIAAVLHPAWPNPFNPGTTIGFSLPRAGQASLEVFAVSGRRISTLVCAPLEAGEHRVAWRGEDEAGLPLASGTYFYRLRFADQPPQTGKLVLLK